MIVVLDVCAFLFALAAFLCMLPNHRQPVVKAARGALLALLALTLFRNFSNVLEWAGLTSSLDVAEDHVETWIPIVWMLSIHLFIRHDADRKVRETHENLVNFFGQLRDYVLVLDEEGRIVTVNSAVLNGLGYSAGELTGRPVEMVHPEDQSAAVHNLMQEIVRGDRDSCDIPLLAKDGRSIPVETKAFSGTWNGRRALIAVCRDISERLAMEEQLRHTEKMRAIGQLAGGIAHDFNNQLSGIMGFAELLGDEAGDNASLRECADNVIKSTRRAAGLTAQLLAFARRGKYQTVGVDLHALIGEVETLLRHTVDKRIRIDCELTAADVWVKGDPTQIQSVLLNLGLNARDAMPEGGSLIYRTRNANVRETDDHAVRLGLSEGDYVVVHVEDSGHGMDEETLKRLFEPFFTTKSGHRGIGMGLAAAYGAVKAHKGGIAVESKTGDGTIFMVYLPIVETPAPEASASPVTRPMPCEGVTILLVDDEEVVRMAGQRLLERAGHDVRVAAGGREALAQYSRDWRKINLVILDLVMPDLDGHAVFTRLREINPVARVLLSTGHSADGIAADMLDNGARGLLRKPYDKRQLDEAIREALA